MAIDSKNWKDYDLIKEIVSLLGIPTIILSLSYYSIYFIVKFAIFVLSIIVFAIISKYKFKFDLRIFCGDYQYSKTNKKTHLKKTLSSYSKEEKYKTDLKFHILYAWIITAMTVAIPLFLSSSNPLSNPNIANELISLDATILIAASIFTALMTQFLGKFDINKQISSLLPLSYCLFTSIVSILLVMFREVMPSLIFTTISIYLLYTLMGAFLFYLKNIKRWEK